MLRRALDWTSILAAAGIPEPPGRAEAVAAAHEAREEKAKREAEALHAKADAPPPKGKKRRR